MHGEGVHGEGVGGGGSVCMVKVVDKCMYTYMYTGLV